MRLNRYLRAQGTSSDCGNAELQPPGQPAWKTPTSPKNPRKQTKQPTAKEKEETKSRTARRQRQLLYGGCGAGCCSRIAQRHVAVGALWGCAALLASRALKVRKVRLCQSCLFVDIAGLEGKRCYFACCFIPRCEQPKAPPKSRRIPASTTNFGLTLFTSILYAAN